MCRKIHLIPDYNIVGGICMSSSNFKNKTDLPKAKFGKKLVLMNTQNNYKVISFAKEKLFR